MAKQLVRPITGPHQIVIGEWALEIQVGQLPHYYDKLCAGLKLADEFDHDEEDGWPLFAAVYAVGKSLDRHAPILTIALTYKPFEAGFDPGFLIVPETDRLFVGAGERLLAYDLRTPSRLWVDTTFPGFWRWGRNRDYVWMLAELEFGVWSASGQKLWTTFVEPPWDANVGDQTVELDIMGRKERRRMFDGQVLA